MLISAALLGLWIGMVHCCEWMWKGRGQYVSNNMGRGREGRSSPEGGDGGSELKARGTNAIYTLQFNAIYTLIQCNANWTVQFSAIDTMDQCNAIYTLQFNALPTDCHMMQIVQTQLRCKTDKTWFCSVFPTQRLVSCC